MENKRFIEFVDYYLDNGFVIMTEEYHKRRGYCCGNGCRHCPYDPKHQRGNVNIKQKDENDDKKYK
jgi:hypothetical protein